MADKILEKNNKLKINSYTIKVGDNDSFFMYTRTVSVYKHEHNINYYNLFQ